VFLFPWYAALCAAQGLLVAAPAVGRETGRRNALLGLAGPAVALVIGVGLVRVLGGSGASLEAWLGTIATPLLAAVLGWAARWPRPLWPLVAVAAAALYVTAWQASGHVAQAAGTILIGGACLAIAGENRVGDGRRPSMPRQQRGMNIQRTEPRYRQHRGGDDLPIRDHDEQVRRYAAQLVSDLGRFDPFRLDDLESPGIGRHLHRRWSRLHAMTGSRRLRDHQLDLVAGFVQRLK